MFFISLFYHQIRKGTSGVKGKNLLKLENKEVTLYGI